MQNHQQNYEQLIRTLTLDAENRQIIAFYRAMIGMTTDVERLVTWLLVAVGGTLGLVIGNYASLSAIPEVADKLRFFFPASFMALIFGFWSRYESMKLSAHRTFIEELHRISGNLGQEYADRKKALIEEADRLKINTDQLSIIDVDLNRMADHFFAPFPQGTARHLRRIFEAGLKNPLRAWYPAVQTLYRQRVSAAMTIISVLVAVSTIAVHWSWSPILFAIFLVAVALYIERFQFFNIVAGAENKNASETK